MTTEFQHNLEKYADVIVNVGLAVQPGQRVLIGAHAFYVIGAPVEHADFVRLLAEKAYQAGAVYVDVIWDDPQLIRTRLQHAPAGSFEEYATWKADVTVAYGERGDAILMVDGRSPDLFAGFDETVAQTVDNTIVRYGGQALGKVIAQNKTQWLHIAVPSANWAAKILPNVRADQQKAQMWEVIFDVCRVRGDDPIADWEKHTRELVARSDYLNNKRYSKLKYTAPGTDLMVGLPDNYLWRAAQLTAQNGNTYVANIPTEEVFTMPHREGVDGIVTATKPLNISGSVIEDFSFTLENGRVVKVTASKGQSALEGLLDADEGARRLGEVALVPHSSPISQSGLLFYNILYDENASCHIALGNAYKFSMEDGVTMPDADFVAAGGNQSSIHVDFMMGSGELDVDGIAADGSSEPLMRGGEWAFDVE